MALVALEVEDLGALGVGLERVDAERAGPGEDPVLSGPDPLTADLDDFPAADRMVQRPATHPSPCLEHDDRVATVDELARGGEPGEPGSDTRLHRRGPPRTRRPPPRSPRARRPAPLPRRLPRRRQRLRAARRCSPAGHLASGPDLVRREREIGDHGCLHVLVAATAGCQVIADVTQPSRVTAGHHPRREPEERRLRPCVRAELPRSSPARRSRCRRSGTPSRPCHAGGSRSGRRTACRRGSRP